MSRLAQLGVFSTVLGVVVLFLGLFPGAAGAVETPGIGLAQISAILVGLGLFVLGAYVVLYAMIHVGRPRNLVRDIGVRLGVTGLLVAASATLADVFGFGSHTGEEGVLLGWLQAVGLLIGFLIAAIGVLVYGSVRYS
ncbi:MAG: hypothetical protein Kow00124_03090 [Anaerolineae bacterium]